jgi:hypothetical protein
MTTDTDTPTPTKLDQIITHQVHPLAQARCELGTLVQALQDGIEQLKADHMPGVRAAIDKAAAAWAALAAQIEEHPELFVRPRTVQAHGIKFGLAKGKGALQILNPDRTVALIRKHLPDQAQVLIATKEMPAKDALAQLSVADLKRIAVDVVDSGDQVVIKPADGEIDRVVRALMKAAVQESDA